MRAADTNVILRLVLGDDPEQAAVAERHSAAGGFWISHLVLLELVWALGSVRYQRSREAIADHVEMLFAHAEITFQAPDMVRSALATFRLGGGVDFSDCLILETARRAGQLPLATFDRALAKLDGVERLV
jgi:predicted nucleic-acid-binding protein